MKKRISHIFKSSRIIELLESDGKLSVTKVGLLVTLFLFHILWVTFSFKRGCLEDIPNGVCLFVAILVGGKVGQTIVDKKMR